MVRPTDGEAAIEKTVSYSGDSQFQEEGTSRPCRATQGNTRGTGPLASELKRDAESKTVKSAWHTQYVSGVKGCVLSVQR